MIDLEYYYMRFLDYLNDLTDLRYGGYFGGFRKTRYSHLGAHDTLGSHYFVLSRLFGKFPVTESDVLVDVGCGKGRVINWWLRKGCKNRIVGIELDENIAATTRKTFEKHKNVEIIQGNALDHIPGDGTIFYLNNPFDRGVLEKFKERLNEKCARKDEMRMYYVCCEFLDAFRGDPDWVVATNYEPVKSDPAWPVRDLDIGISFPLAVIEPGHANAARQ